MRPAGRSAQASWWLAALVAIVGASDVASAASACGDPARVTLDIGHSPGRGGTTSARGRPEYAFNRRFVGELRSALEADGRFEVRVINEAGADISLTARAQQVAALPRGVFLSIHHDSVQPHYMSEWTVDGRTRRYSDVFRGYSLFVSNRGADFEGSTDLARGIAVRLRAAGFRPSLHHGEAIPGENRPLIDAANGIYRYDGLAVLKNARIPAVLFEVGIIVNRDEELALDSAATRALAIAAIIGAVAEACS